MRYTISVSIRILSRISIDQLYKALDLELTYINPPPVIPEFSSFLEWTDWLRAMAVSLRCLGRRPLKNSDLWKVLDSAISDLKNAGFNAVFKHIPAHVGIYDNEKADRLVKAAMKPTHKAVPRTTAADCRSTRQDLQRKPEATGVALKHGYAVYRTILECGVDYKFRIIFITHQHIDHVTTSQPHGVIRIRCVSW